MAGMSPCLLPQLGYGTVAARSQHENMQSQTLVQRHRAVVSAALARRPRTDHASVDTRILTSVGKEEVQAASRWREM